MTDDSTRFSREFTALSLAAGVTAATASAAATADRRGYGRGCNDFHGSCDAALIHPRVGSMAGVILFVDLFGLGRRCATWRSAWRRTATPCSTESLLPHTKAPGLPMTLDFNSPDDAPNRQGARAF